MMRRTIRLVAVLRRGWAESPLLNFWLLRTMGWSHARSTVVGQTEFSLLRGHSEQSFELSIAAGNYHPALQEATA
jgi:hypothetical protein